MKDIRDSFKSNRGRDTASTSDKDHGRIEYRTCSIMQDLRDIQNQQEWAGLKTILKMERERTVISTNQTTYETL